MNLCETVIAMRELLTPDGAWCQNACWRDEAGSPIVEMSAATSHCLYGAAQSVNGTFSVGVALCCFLNEQVPSVNGFIEWNDTKGRTQAEVLAFLDECIAKLTPKPKKGHSIILDNLKGRPLFGELDLIRRELEDA